MSATDHLAQALSALMAAEDDNFVSLVRLSGLDPLSDFQNADLSGTDLRGADLRGFDLTNARFKGARIDGARFPSSVSPAALSEAIAEIRPPTTLALLKIFVLAEGERAQQIARRIAPPDWTPTAMVNDPARFRLGQTTDEAVSDAVAEIHIHKPDKASPKGVSIVVAITDDEACTARAHERLETLGFARSGPILRLLAPALSEDSPSTQLLHVQQPHLFDALIDTSIARSPSWTGAASVGFTQRMATLIVDCAVLAQEPDSKARLFTERWKAPALLALQFTRGPTSPASKRSSAYGSETLGLLEAPATARVTVRIARKAAPPRSREWAVLLICRPQPQDRGFLSSIVETVLDRKGASAAVTSAPKSLCETLTFPERAEAYSGVEHPETRVLLTLEKPDLHQVRLAAEQGWRIARYTDRQAIARLGEWRPQGYLPSELRLPPLRRQPKIINLVSRGPAIDDTVALTVALAKAVKAHAPELAKLLRRRNSPGPSRDGASLVLPAADVEEWLQDPRAAPELASELKLARISRSRVASRSHDIQRLWSAPHLTAPRYAILDMAIPIRLAPLGNDEVPPTSAFVIHGDESVPVLFQSSVFETWVRAVASRLPGEGDARLSTSFESFPIPRAFSVQSVFEGPPFLRMNDATAGELAQNWRAVLDEEVVDWRKRSSWTRETLKLRGSVDELVLRLYGLPANAKDYEILEHLLAMNQTPDSG